MPPTLVLIVSVPGMVYVNGRFAGEATPDRPLTLPVSPYGGLYIEFRPLVAGFESKAFKAVLSGGQLMADSLCEDAGIFALQWPGPVLEIEISTFKPEIHFLTIENHPCLMVKNGKTRLFINTLTLTLPDGAEIPRIIHSENIPMLLGNISNGGQYLMTFDRDFTHPTGTLIADQIDFPDALTLQARQLHRDRLNHGQMDTFKVTPSGLERLASEPFRPSGAPLWPQVPKDILLAGFEALLGHYDSEIESLFVPELFNRLSRSSLESYFDLCLPIRYMPADPRPCIGLMKLENAVCGRVFPLHGHLRTTSDPQLPFQIDDIDFADLKSTGFPL